MHTEYWEEFIVIIIIIIIIVLLVVMVIWFDFVRRTLRKFSLDVDSLCDEAVHLTNVAVQKKQPDYKDLLDTQVRTTLHQILEN